MVSLTSPKEALFACPPTPPYNSTFFSMGLTLPIHVLTLISLIKMRLLPFLIFSPHGIVIWTDGFFLFGKGGSGVLANCSLCSTAATLSYLAGQVCSSFSAETCTILQAFRSSSLHQQVCHFPSLRLSLCPRCTVFSVLRSISHSLTNLAGTILSLFRFFY